jgi:undecaprenyl-diphosphatase
MPGPARRPAPAPRLALRHAVGLGLTQGPTELLPVSSSAHTALIPWFAGWPYGELDAELRNAFEVALHAGTAVALLIAMRGELVQAARASDRRRAALVALAVAPPALVGYLLERGIERRPSTPGTIAAGLVLGGIAMALADTRESTRAHAGAWPRDGLLLGLAQAVALLPGVSRNGATLTVARLRGFAREDAQALSWLAGLPVIVGAAALKGRRLAQRGLPADAGPALAVGAAAAFLSTLAGAPLIRPGRRGRRLLPFALYRCGLAASVVVPRPHNGSR